MSRRTLQDPSQSGSRSKTVESHQTEKKNGDIRTLNLQILVNNSVKNILGRIPHPRGLWVYQTILDIYTFLLSELAEKVCSTSSAVAGFPVAAMLDDVITATAGLLADANVGSVLELMTD